MCLPDYFVDECLLEMFPLFDQAQLQLVDIMLLQLSSILRVNRVEVTTVS